LEELFFKLGTDLTTGEKSWSRDFFKLGGAGKIIREKISFESLGFEPRTNEIEAGTSNPNQKTTFPKDGNRWELNPGPAMLRPRVQTQTKIKLPKAFVLSSGLKPETH
jgi:hypothetical protein